MLRKRILSYFLILAVSGTVLSGALFLMTWGIRNESNITLVSELITRHNYAAANNNVRSPEVMGVNYLPVEIDTEEISSCQIEGRQNHSIVDYLIAKGEDSSFDHRANLAVEFNMARYSGSQKENLELIALLKSRFGCI